jgi:hypothetical protein
MAETIEMEMNPQRKEIYKRPKITSRLCRLNHHLGY